MFVISRDSIAIALLLFISILHGCEHCKPFLRLQHFSWTRVAGIEYRNGLFSRIMLIDHIFGSCLLRYKADNSGYAYNNYKCGRRFPFCAMSAQPSGSDPAIRQSWLFCGCLPVWSTRQRLRHRCQVAGPSPSGLTDITRKWKTSTTLVIAVISVI